MEVVSCLFGHQDVLELAFVGRDRLGQNHEAFRIMRCRECGLLFVSPRPTPTEIAQYYPYETYEPFRAAIEDKPWIERWHLGYIQDQRCRFVEKAKARGRLLDVGCATGNFLARIRKRGNWEVHGVEINREAAEYAAQRFGLNVFHGTLEEAHYPSDFFDIVTLWSVLEHLHDPLESLREIQRILRPDGILGLTIPFGDSLDARLFGPHWAFLDPPRHLYTFTRTALDQLFEQTGFETVKTQSFTAGYLSLWRSIRSCIQNGEPVSDKILRRIPFLFIPSKPFRVLTFPYVWMTAKTGHGATISVLARPA